MEAKTSNNFTSNYSRHYTYKMLPTRTINHLFHLILTSTSLPYKRATLTRQQKETQKLKSIEISNFFIINGRRNQLQCITKRNKSV